MELKIKLPEPKYKSEISIEEALLKRRSIRKYKDISLSIEDISQILWSAQGITDKKRYYRTSPSAGATFPLEVYVVIGNVKNISKGVYKYLPLKHEIIKIKDGDVREELRDAAFGQSWVGKAPVVIVFSADYKRTTLRYGNRGMRYVYMEVGHAAQNIHLQVISLKLGTVVVGAFNDEHVKEIINMPDEEYPLYLMPIGKI